MTGPELVVKVPECQAGDFDLDVVVSSGEKMVL